MFADPTYLYIYDHEFNDEEAYEDCYEEPWVVNMCRLMTLHHYKNGVQFISLNHYGTLKVK
jgi:hypothetical protein